MTMLRRLLRIFGPKRGPVQGLTLAAYAPGTAGGEFTYLRPGGVDTYLRPDGTSSYLRP